MGDRYHLTMTCPKCGSYDDDVYFAPTCGFTEWTCPDCKHVVDLEELTGISYDEASNVAAMETLTNGFMKAHRCVDDFVIRAKLANLTSRRKSLKRFYKWFMPIYINHRDNPTELMSGIVHAFSEYSSGLITRTELVSRLVNYRS